MLLIQNIANLYTFIAFNQMILLSANNYSKHNSHCFWLAGNTSISYQKAMFKTHWGRVTHICVDILTIIGSDNGLSPGRHQAINWINAGVLLIGPIGTNLSEILIPIITFLFKKKCIWKCRLENVGHFVLALMCYKMPFTASNVNTQFC